MLLVTKGQLLVFVLQVKTQHILGERGTTAIEITPNRFHWSLPFQLLCTQRVLSSLLHKPHSLLW